MLDVWDRIVSCWIANLISSKPDPDGTSCHSLLEQLSSLFLLTVNDDMLVLYIYIYIYIYIHTNTLYAYASLVDLHRLILSCLDSDEKTLNC